MHDNAHPKKQPPLDLLLLGALQRANLEAVESGDTGPALRQLLQGFLALLDIDGIAVFAAPEGHRTLCLATAGDSEELEACCDAVLAAREPRSLLSPQPHRGFPLLFRDRTIGALAIVPSAVRPASFDVERVKALLPVLTGWVRLHTRLADQNSMLEDLRDSERRYRGLVEVCNELILSVRADGRILFVNAEWRRALHLDGVPCEGRSIFDYLHPDSLQHCRAAFDQAARGKPMRGVEVVFRSHLGDKVVVEGDVLPQIVDGVVVATQAFFRDTTQQRASEAARVWSTAFLDQVVESAPEAIVFLGLDDRVQRLNSEFTRLFHYTASEALGRKIDELVVPPTLSVEGRELCQRAGQSEVVNVETVRRRKDGSELAVSLLATPIRVNDIHVATLCIYRDISERRQLEATLAQSQRMEAIGRLAGGISHDFNNLLMVITATTDMLLEKLEAGSTFRSDLNEIALASDRAVKLTGQLLAFSRRQVLSPLAMNVNDVVHEVAKMLSRLIGEDIRLVVRTAPDLGCVRADPTQIEQVLLNLALNARDAMQRGGLLTIATRDVWLDDTRSREWSLPKGNYVEIAVEDTGCGIPPHELDLIFEPFWSTKAVDGRGTGLGLSTAYGTVKQSDGAITVRSEVGKGSQFCVLLPRSDREAVETTAVQDAPPQGSAETILVVEDDQVIRSLVERALTNAGYRVFAASTAPDAVSLMNQHRDEIALLFTDVIMPETSGPELAAQLREIKPVLRVLYTSGHADDRVFKLTGALDSAHFLAKPYTLSILVERVRRALDA